MTDKKYTAADIVIDTLKNNGVEYVFGIPGAKIDYLFNVLNLLSRVMNKMPQ